MLTFSEILNPGVKTGSEFFPNPDPSFFQIRIRKRYPTPDPNNFFSECMCPDSKRTDITSSHTAQKVEMSFKSNFAEPGSVFEAPNPIPA